MSKRVKTPSRTESGSQTPTDQLSDSALHPLAELRRAVDNRLAVLEGALADPSQGESLAGLILDLTRVATEEAQAAASQACLTTKAEADEKIAGIRASAQTALEAAQTALTSAHADLEQERTTCVDLRVAMEQAQQEIQKQAEILTAHEQLEAELRSARERLEADLARHLAIGTELERTAADAQQQLQTERSAKADLQRWAEDAEAQLATLAREHDEGRIARESVLAELAGAREAAAGLEKAHAEVLLQLEAERALGAELRRAAEDAAAVAAALGNETSRTRATHEELEAELGRRRDEAAHLQRSLAEAQETVDTERAASAELRAAIDRMDQQLAMARNGEVQATADAQRELAQAHTEAETLRANLEAAQITIDAIATERDSLAGQLQDARKWIDEAREAEAEFATAAPLASASPAAAAFAFTVVDAPAEDQATEAGGDEGWQALRLASRWVFRDEIAVLINGDAGALFDLSVSGCQVLSPAALKPGHTVKVQLPAGSTTITCTGLTVWTRLEPTAAGQPPRYRAGVRFTKADETAVEAFAALHGATA